MRFLYEAEGLESLKPAQLNPKFTAARTSESWTGDTGSCLLPLRELSPLGWERFVSAGVL